MFDCLSVNVRSKLTFVQMFSGEHINNNFSLNTQKNEHHHTGLEGYSWLRNDLRSKTVHDKLQFTLTSSNFWFGVLIKMQTSFISKLKLKQIFKVALTELNKLGHDSVGNWCRLKENAKTNLPKEMVQWKIKKNKIVVNVFIREKLGKYPMIMKVFF